MEEPTDPDKVSISVETPVAQIALKPQGYGATPVETG
jgi:hypothetical protein